MADSSIWSSEMGTWDNSLRPRDNCEPFADVHTLSTARMQTDTEVA
ncbi:hypothetical protein SNOG_03598 [Parastagonospora nodorum SN15]|uniref:Uncharacterized protein n=1 Tax=Phaeosphaeria nodorum (strain SN15 / ATCC MYA-4574 / FGSC 10173) TaxID=321614 RepID=Q0UXB6_PHANO|nr:hypothetical protein SNOG_03598 [Parastagonospora nodorum SN15]EAT88803.1 hypothetical protein SNOG_03598 [Parastagonospora nodorum SN15]